ncbi:hypothetical protein M9H77_09105 [Catharanthus roseus]|uniref:Uncharacterized protein n=1 Tax=Catharanthus roseus TaxID=4058 RepID=A0ACC0BZQ0_CATRO|nr:hypothetical protein M9H77_09105 [Catharanthus roseus]
MPQMIMPQPLAKTERAIFMTSEDIILIKQIMATHTPDSYEINVKPIFQIVEDILTNSTITTPDNSSLLTKTEAPREKPNNETLATMLEALSYIINRLSSEAKNRGGVFRENFVVLFS